MDERLEQAFHKEAYSNSHKHKRSPTNIRGHPPSQSPEWLTLQRLTITSANKEVEQMELSYTANEYGNWHTF